MFEKLPEAEVIESQNINSGVDFSSLVTLSETASQAVSLVLYMSYTYIFYCFLIYIFSYHHVIVMFCLYKQERLPTNNQTTKFGSTSSPVAINPQPQPESNVEKARREFHAGVAPQLNPQRQPKNSGDKSRSYLETSIASQQVSLLIN